MKKFIFLFLILNGINVFAQNSSATLINFRIESNQPDRVYFDSSVPLTGSNHKGFYITGNNISDIQISSGNTSGHFIVVSKAFTFWDNNTIRYEGGSDIKDEYTNALPKFDLQYIVNGISEPDARVDRYVTVSGSGRHDGTLGNEWTLEEACKNAVSGETVHIKAGDYGSGKFVVSNKGTSTAPIKFEGYRSSPGDRPTLVRTPGTQFSATQMPYIHSKGSSGNGFSTSGSQYVIVRNIQVEGYESSISIKNSNYAVLDNVYTRGGQNYCISGFDHALIQGRIINSYAADSPGHGIRVAGERNLIDNLYVSSYGRPDMDYYISVYGSKIGSAESIVRNCKIIRDPNDTHTGHGISLRGNGVPVENSLVEDIYIEAVGSAIEVRSEFVQRCVFRNIKVDNLGLKKGSFQAIRFTGGQHNVLDKITGINCEWAVQFLGSDESPTMAPDAGNHNIIKNSLFYNSPETPGQYVIYVRKDKVSSLRRVPNNNRFENCTFYNFGSLMYKNETSKDNGNKFVNCIIDKVPKELSNSSQSHSWTFEYTNIWNSWGKESGTGNKSVDPKFKGATRGDFRLDESSPLIDQGTYIKGVHSDYNGDPRPQGESHDMGAFEFTDDSVVTLPPIKADAGEDEQICLGEEITLTASGGGSYLWSTGSTESSIQVSPSETTTYSVEVSDSGRKATDEVTITVNTLEADAGEDKDILAGEEVTLTASGGDTYEWSTGENSETISVSPASTETYTVTVFKDGCSVSDQVVVNVLSDNEVVAEAGNDVTIYEGETVTLTASGGTTYKWSNGATSKSIKVSPGSTTKYTVTVSIGTTSDDDDVIVTVLPNQVVANAGNDVTINEGESVTLTASGGANYKWSTGATTKSIIVSPNSTTKYSVTVSEGNASDKDDVLVTVVPTVVSTPVLNSADAGEDVSICLGERVTLTGSGGSYYEWSTGSKGNSIEVNPVRTTTYTLYATTDGRTTSDTVVVTVENCDISVSRENEVELEIDIYPNPSSEILNINMSASDHELNLSMISTTGSIMYDNRIISKSSGATELIDVSRFESGIYFVRLSSPSESVVKKVIII